MTLSRKFTPSRIISLAVLTLLVAAPHIAFAQEKILSSEAGTISIGVGILLGLAAAAGVLAQGKAVASAVESIGRNPGAAGMIFRNLVIGLALIESIVVLSFVIALSLVGKF
jgi:F-type H+-transporting ATPase subunit c